ncbi:hypothetical protein HPB47_020709 [Ixodes persulcatus]|uniref:Uncharacterized protein n=1 Tax=Ixodes persulcatus TaxID=34615 RepID=A0AC60QI62_IXOPE|nr:hypothetical protein HPB47_020709 [Ixodes persulcatus]
MVDVQLKLLSDFAKSLLLALSGSGPVANTLPSRPAHLAAAVMEYALEQVRPSSRLDGHGPRGARRRADSYAYTWQTDGAWLGSFRRSGRYELMGPIRQCQKSKILVFVMFLYEFYHR